MNILTKRHEGEVNRVMSNSFGFGGTNAALLFVKGESDEEGRIRKFLREEVICK